MSLDFQTVSNVFKALVRDAILRSTSFLFPFLIVPEPVLVGCFSRMMLHKDVSNLLPHITWVL